MTTKQLLNTAFACIAMLVFQFKSVAQQTVIDMNECTMILEIETKRYCISNVSYSSSYNSYGAYPSVSEDGSASATSTEPATEIYYSLSINLQKGNVTQELLDWAFINPSKKAKGSIKIYNTTKTKVLKEIKFEDATLSSYSDSDDIVAANNYGSNFSLNCKKLSIKLTK
jgi:hypothetical protein